MSALIPLVTCGKITSFVGLRALGRKEKIENFAFPSLYSLSVTKISSTLSENMKDALECLNQLPNNIQDDIMLSMINLSIKQHHLACHASKLFSQRGFIQHSFYQGYRIYYLNTKYV